MAGILTEPQRKRLKGGGVHAGVQSVGSDKSVERHTGEVDNKFGEEKQWTQKLWGFVREAFGDG